MSADSRDEMLAAHEADAHHARTWGESDKAGYEAAHRARRRLEDPVGEQTAREAKRLNRQRLQEGAVLRAAGLSAAEAAEIVARLDQLIRRTAYYVGPGTYEQACDIATEGAISVAFGPAYPGAGKTTRILRIDAKLPRHRRWDSLAWMLALKLEQKQPA